MIRKILSIVAISLFSLSAFAVSETLDTGNIVDLMNDSNSISVQVNYPGMPDVTNICGVKIISSETVYSDKMQKLVNMLNVTDGVDQKPTPLAGKAVGYFSASAKYELVSSETYMTLVNVSTKSGKSLREDIVEALEVDEETIVGLVSTPCKVN